MWQIALSVAEKEEKKDLVYIFFPQEKVQNLESEIFF